MKTQCVVTIWCLALGLLASSSLAQPSKWRPANGTSMIDLTSLESQRHLRFLADGVAMESNLALMMIGNGAVQIEVKVPGHGEVKLVSDNPKSQLEIIPRQRRDNIVRFQIKRTVSAPNAQQLQNDMRRKVDDFLRPFENKVRQAPNPGENEMRSYLKKQGVAAPAKNTHNKYVRARAAHEARSEIIKRIRNIAGKYPQFVSGEEQAKLKGRSGHQLQTHWNELLQYEFAADQLSSCGMRWTQGAGWKRDIGGLFEALRLAMNGDAGRNQELGSKVDAVLTGSNVTALGQALSARLSARYYTPADKKDPNSFWFNGQRVTAGGRGISSIKVHGALDPRGGDKVDWWIIDQYDASSVSIRKSEGTHEIGPPIVRDKKSYIRVETSSDQAGSYWFELVNRAGKGASVSIHEVSEVTNVRFPF